MDLSLYNILTQQLSPPPDLSQVKQGQLLPEEWPVVLEKISTFRKQVRFFTITDGRHSVICHSNVPDLYDRITATELGTIIHLLGSRTVFDPQHRCYILYIEDFATLKQYDEHLRRIREAEARRLADLADEITDYHRIRQD